MTLYKIDHNISYIINIPLKKGAIVEINYDIFNSFLKLILILILF